MHTMEYTRRAPQDSAPEMNLDNYEQLQVGQMLLERRFMRKYM